MTIKPLAMRDVFLERIWQGMHTNDQLFFVSADFGSPVLDKIRGDFPERFINVGIAEQNLINVSAGLALEGFTVFAYAIAPFITMRCYEQIRVSLALLSEVRPMNVNLIGVGAGYSYVVSGPTHQCYEDITLMRALPNFQVLSPSDHVAADTCFDLCMEHRGLNYLRFDAQVLPVIYQEPFQGDRGFHVHTHRGDICLLATGYMVHTALTIAEALAEQGIHVGVVDMFALGKVHEHQLTTLLAFYRGVVTMEEGFRGRGGLDALLFDLIARHGLNIKVCNIGVQPAYQFDLGARQDLHEKVGIGPQAVYQQVQDFLGALDGEANK